MIDQRSIQVYVDTDVEFEPRAVTHVSFRNAGGLMSALDSAQSLLYSALVEDSLNSLAYPALLAGVSYQVAAAPKGFRVSIGGYEDKQFVLLEQVMRRLIDLEIDNERFDVLKNRLIKDFENQAKDKPFQQVYGRLMDELVSSAWPSQEMLAVLKPLTNEQLSSWRDNVFSEVSLQALIHGNVRMKKQRNYLH